MIQVISAPADHRNSRPEGVGHLRAGARTYGSGKLDTPQTRGPFQVHCPQGQFHALATTMNRRAAPVKQNAPIRGVLWTTRGLSLDR